MLTALNAVETRHDLVDLARLWPDLRSGARRVVDHWSTQQAFGLVVEKFPVAASASPNCFDVLEALLLGTYPMLVAMDRAVTRSSLELETARALRALGLDPPKLKTVPVVIAVAVHACQGATALTTGRAQTVEHLSARQTCINVGRFDAALLGEGTWPQGRSRSAPSLATQPLTAAEVAIVRLCVEGRSVREIASFRGTAMRTVTNQAGSALAKLGVSTRAQLLSKLIRAAPQ